MSDRVQDVSRRDLLRITLTTLGVNVVNAEAAQHVHQAVAEVKKTGVYKAKFFTEHEYKTLEKLADLIIPADDHSPGALAGGAPEFIDFLCSQCPELAEIYTGGLAWLDHQMKKRDSASFIAAAPERQTAMLDLIAFRKNTSAELAPGIHFFDWVRNMTVDAFYTSKAGMDDLGYMGNSAMSEFHVPADAIEYAVKRSGLD
jgi:gluconate 2-dehydrogenase subunit 3-like protein